KAGTSSALDTASDKTSGTTSLILGIASLASQAYAEVSEQADLRVSRYFPGKAWVGGFNMQPGRYSYQVNFYNKAGQILATQYFTDVTVNPLALNLTEAYCLR
ncbi:MAG: hypothetical protein FWF29_09350, partial [Treponema sp.]|nr:hypothetical protein [Treponema sp.]